MFKNFPKVSQAANLRSNTNNQKKITLHQIAVKTTKNQWPEEKRQIIFKVTQIKPSSIFITETT